MLATRDVYGEVLAELGAERREIVVLDADLSGSTRTSKFAAKFPERFFNFGVAEQDMISTASGLALGGKIPFVSSFAIFASGRAWEQVRQSVCLPNRDVKIVATHGGLTVGEDGASHQALEDIAIMRVLPNMKVIVPSDGYEVTGVMRAIIENPGPTYVRLSRSKSPIIHPEPPPFEIGKSEVLREGEDVSIMAAGLMVSTSLEAAEKLEKEGIEAAVINMSTIKPIDREGIRRAAKRTGAIVTAEEHSIIGGLGSAVAEVLVEEHPVPMKMVGVRDLFGRSGSPTELLELYGLTSEDIASAARDVIKKKGSGRGALSL